MDWTQVDVVERTFDVMAISRCVGALEIEAEGLAKLREARADSAEYWLAAERETVGTLLRCRELRERMQHELVGALRARVDHAPYGSTALRIGSLQRRLSGLLRTIHSRVREIALGVRQ